MLARIAILVLTLSLPLHAAANAPAWCSKLPRQEFSRFQKVAQTNEWFDVYKIKPYVYALYEPHHREEMISYLIIGTKRALLFDTGMGIGNIKQVVGQLTNLPVVVVNSHSHPNHVGDNWRFQEIYAIPSAHHTNKAALHASDICGKLPTGFNLKTYQSKPYHITHYLHDREKIDLGDRTLHVIATKGHSPDSLALYDNQDGILLTGDTFHLGAMHLNRPDANLYDYAQSLDKLAGISKVKTLLFSHNVPTATPAYLKQGKEALSKVLLGKAPARIHADKQEYRFEKFAILLQANRSASMKA